MVMIDKIYKNFYSNQKRENAKQIYHLCLQCLHQQFLNLIYSLDDIICEVFYVKYVRNENFANSFF